MPILKNITMLFIGIILVSNASDSLAVETCTSCDNKIVGAQNPPLGGIEKVVKVVDENQPTFDEKMYITCLRFEQTSPNSLLGVIRDLKNTPYPTDDFLTKAGCRPANVGGNTTAPMLHLTPDKPCARLEFPEIIYKYYTIIRKEPNIWLEVVNAKNTRGESYLDYIQKQIDDDILGSEENESCARQLISFACKTGGKYSKYKKTCPSEYLK